MIGETFKNDFLITTEIIHLELVEMIRIRCRPLVVAQSDIEMFLFNISGKTIDSHLSIFISLYLAVEELTTPMV